jgi:hypothetical protein
MRGWFSMARPEHEIRDSFLATELRSTKELLDLYRLAQDVRKYHHSALWEIEKHFTWWASVLLGACVLILANTDKIGEPTAYFVLGTIAVVGVLLSIMGKSVVEREGEYFSEALQICNRVARALGLESRYYDVAPRRRPNGMMEPEQFFLYPSDYWIRDFGEVKDEAKLRLLTKLLKGRLNVRDYFRLVLAASAVAFLSIGVIAALLGEEFSRPPCRRQAPARSRP